MPDVEFANLLIVAAIALLAPLTLGFAPSLRVPAVVLEIVAGIVVGPHGLGWVDVDLPIQIVSLIGLAFLLFLAGLEVDVHQLTGPLLRIALLGFAVTLVLGSLVGVGLHAVDWVKSPTLVAVTLAATSLGLVVPVLKYAGQIESPLGQATIASASVAPQLQPAPPAPPPRGVAARPRSPPFCFSFFFPPPAGGAALEAGWSCS